MHFLSIRSVVGCAAVVLCAGCAPLSDVKAPDSTSIPMKTYSQPYVVAPLDRVYVTKKDGEISTLIINPESKLEYPAGSTINTAGLSIDQLSTKLKKADPAITSVRYEEFRANSVALTGEVNIQTHLDLQDAPIRALDAISAAGGFTPLANTRRVRLLRQNAGKVIVYELNMNDVMHGRNMQQNLLLQPGDSIFVPRTLL